MIKKLSVLFFCIINLSFAQQDSKAYEYTNIELLSVLNQIEKDFDIKFSYNPDWINGITVNLSLEKPTLSELIVMLEHQLHFSFNKLDERYFVLKPINKLYVCGYLKDKNEIPISGATIQNLNHKKVTITNNNGYFQLSEINKNDTIVISSLGYTTKKNAAISFYKKCENIYLEEKFYTLNEVVVKEYLSSSVSLKNGGVVNFDLKKPDILAGQAEPDILQTIQLLPSVDSTTENASDILIRGSTPDKNLVLWDGIKLYNTDHFFGTITNLNSSIVNNVALHKSGVSAEYGDRISGVIDISLDNDVPKKIEASLGFNLLHSDFTLKTPITNKLGLFISTRRSFVDFYKSDIFSNNFNRIFQNSRVNLNRTAFEIDPNEKQEQSLIYEDHSAKIIYAFNKKHKLSSTILFTNNEFNDEASFLADEVFGGVKTTFFDILKIKNLGTSFIYNSKWNSKIRTNLAVKYSNYDLNYLGFNFDPIFAFPFPLERENSIKELTSNFNFYYDFNKYLNLLVGYELLNTRFKYRLRDRFFDDRDTFNVDQRNKPSHSVYNQVSYQKNNKGNLSIGVRLTKFANFDKVKWEPRLNVEKNIHEKLRVKASAELRRQSINRIDISSGFDTGEENEVWLPTDQDTIPLLKSLQLTTGVVFEKKNWVIDIDAYYKKTEGLIAYPTTTSNRVNLVPDRGEGIVKGIDFFIKKRIKNYTTWLGYTYATNKQKFEIINDNIAFNANNDIRHSLTWSHFLQLKDFQLSLGWKYRTGIPFTVITELSIIPTDFDKFDTFNGGRTPNYHRLDFSLTYNIGLSRFDNYKNAKIGVSIQNLYNRKNILNTQFRRFVASTDIDLASSRVPIRFDTKSLGITPNIFVRFNF